MKALTIVVPNALALMLFAATTLLAEARGMTRARRPVEPAIGDRRTAPDGITKGHLVLYPFPTDEPSQQWRTIATTLVLTRHGRVILRLKTDTSFWGWQFWDGGRQVAYEVGPLHGTTECVLKEVRNRRQLASFKGDCRDKPENAPGWVRSIE